MSSRNILCRPKMPVIFLTLLLVSYCRGRIVHARAPFSTHAVALNVRGGSQGPSSSISYDPSSPYDGQTSAAPQGDFYAPPIPVADDENDPFHESVQARVDSWRSQQLERSAELQESLRDDQGRVKLLSTVSRGSRAFIFFMLLFRNIHLFEVADQVFSGFTRLLVVTPLLLLFIGNFAGLVASFTAPSHSAKKRLKAILNLDKLLEGLLIIYYFFRLTVAPSKLVPRDIYISGILHSAFFILQCQGFTRLSWDDAAPKPIGNVAMDQGLQPQQPGNQQRPQRPDAAWYNEPPPNQSQQPLPRR